MNPNVEKIANNYGYEEQCRMAQEECAELIQAINKHHRKRSNVTLENLVEEMADVQIMIEQMVYLLDCHKQFGFAYEWKLQRQLGRMRDEQESIG